MGGSRDSCTSFDGTFRVGLGGLMGCQPPIKNQTSSCPENFIQDYKNYDDKSVSESKVSELKTLCSPRSQGYPENDINKASARLTSECVTLLNQLIPWRGNFEGNNVDTEREEELKRVSSKEFGGPYFFIGLCLRLLRGWP